MALDKKFKVKDTITVGQSGLFGNTVQIGVADDYISVNPALDVWGPILSGGIDLAEFIGDGVDAIYKGDSQQGTIKYQTQDDAYFSPSIFTHVEVQGLQVYDTPTFANLALSGTSDVATISGAQTIVIDPAGYNDGGDKEAGSVRIKGDLFVDGDTFRVNSTTVSLSDAIIELGQSEAGSISGDNQLPSSGIGISAGTIANASILYQGGTTGWEVGSPLTVNGNADFDSNVNIDGTLHVDGVTTMDGNVTLSGSLTIATEDDSSDTNLVISQNGNIDTDGKLNVAQLATFEQTEDSIAIASTGTVSISGDLIVNDYGASDTNYLTVDNSSGLTTISDLTVTDLTEDQIVLPSASGNLEGDANFTFNGTQLNIGQGKLTVQQASGNIHSEGNITLVGTTTLSGDVTVRTTDTDEAKLTIANSSGDLTTRGTVTLSGDLVVNTSDAGDTNLLTVDNSTGETTIASATISDLTDNKIVIAGTSGSLESGNIQDTGTMVTVETALNVDEAATFDKTVEIDGATTINNTVTLSGADTTASSVEYVYVGAAVAADADASYTDTLPVADLNAAKFIVAVDNGATGKSVIELLVARNDQSGALDGTAYGQVDVGTSQITDIDIAESNSTVGITVTGTAGAVVTVFGTGYYN